MRHIRKCLLGVFACAMVAGAYLAGGFTAGLLAAEPHAMARKPVPVSIEIAERVAAL